VGNSILTFSAASEIGDCVSFSLALKFKNNRHLLSLFPAFVHLRKFSYPKL
jgi:hypothetical protein